MTHELQYAKEKTALKFFLIGRGYDKALKALGFAERYHVGLRKDGKTPEFHHQIRIALHVTQLKYVMNEERCIILALLHDIQEDYQIPIETIREYFGLVVSEKIWKLTKKFQGEHKTQAEYIEQIALDPDCSIVKGLDRCDNLETMVGVFDAKKMTSYSNEAFRIFLTMLRKASKLFPEQQTSYHTILIRMKQLISAAQYTASLMNDRDTAMKDATDTFAQVRRRNQECLDLTNKVMDQAVEQRTSWALTNSKNKEEHDERVQSMVEMVMKGDLKNDNVSTFKKIAKVISQNRSKLNLKEASIGPILVMIQHEMGISELELTDFHEKHITGPIPSK